MVEGHYFWTERSVPTAAKTGKQFEIAHDRSAGAELDCWPKGAGAEPPFGRHVKVEIEENAKLVDVEPAGSSLTGLSGGARR